MIPDDWRVGMENEAASVKDVQWAQETQRAVLQGKRRKLLLDSLISLGAALALAVMWMTLRVLVLRAASQMDSNPLGVWANANWVRFDLVMLTLLLATGLILGWLGIRPRRLVPFLALIPVLLWIIALSIDSEGVWSGTAAAPVAPYSADFAFFQLRPGHLAFSTGAALVGFLSAWTGLILRRKNLGRHSAIKRGGLDDV